MMKRTSRYSRASRVLVLLLCALLLAGMLPSFGALGAAKKNAGEGSLTVSLKTNVKKLPKGAKVEFTLYKIGTPAPETAAGWKFDTAFSKYGNKIIRANTDTNLQKEVDKLAKDLIKNKVKGITKDLSKGSAEFKGLEDGIYVGVLTKHPVGLTANASLITIPLKDPKTAALSRTYAINVKDKYVEPTPTPTPVVTVTPTATTPSGGGGGGGGGGAPVPAVTPTPTTDISGTKIWVDNGNQHNVRPGAISITLYADGSPVSAEPSWTKSGDHWIYTFSGLPKVDSSGSEISYTVEEAPVEYYESTVSGLTITNKLIERPPEEYTDLSGEKTWNDNDNASGKRPTTITVRLLRDGVEVESRTVTAGTGWKYSFQHLPVDDGYGHTYTYAIREDGVSGYFSRIEGNDLVNTLIDGSTPPPPTGDDETPPPDGITPNIPEKPEDIPDRKTGTPVPPFADLSDEMLEELFDMFGYGTPLYGILGTGDQIPVWVWICGAVGIFALAMAIVMGRKKKRTR